MILVQQFGISNDYEDGDERCFGSAQRARSAASRSDGEIDRGALVNGQGGQGRVAEFGNDANERVEQPTSAIYVAGRQYFHDVMDYY